MSKILAQLYDSILFPAVEKTLEIPISDRPKANMPYAMRHEALARVFK